MSTKYFSFGKEERLCSTKIIDQLFNEGKSFVKYPFRITVLPVNDQIPKEAQILISVPKRKFKRAYKRNLLKRRIREAYRLNKHPLLNSLHDKQLKLALSFVYLPSEILDYSNIEKGMIKALKQVQSKYATHE